MIIFGTKTYATVMALATIVCGNCRNPAANRLHRITRKFTLFFVPLFPVSTSYVLECAFCGVRSKLTREQADAFAAHAHGSQQPPVQQPPVQQPPNPPTYRG